MKGDDEFASCDDYLTWAMGEQDIEKQKELFEKAYVADPSRKEEIFEVARELALKSISRRTNGQGRIL